MIAEEIYEVAANGNVDALRWLIAWHAWCHNLDDHIDEVRPNAEVVDIVAQACVLFSGTFFRQHAEALGPLVAIVAAQYKASLSETDERLRDALRITGNQVVLAVAYLTGGLSCVDRTGQVLWGWVLATQL